MNGFERGHIDERAVVSDGAVLGAGVTVGAFAIVYDGVKLGDGSFIGPHSIVGEPAADYYEGDQATPRGCEIGAGSVIRSHSVIYDGVTAGPGLSTGHRVTIREGSVLGADCRIGTLSDLQGDLTVGDHVRMHSSVHIGRLSTIEDFVWIFPFVVLTNDPHPPSDTCTQGPTIRRYAVLATNSVIMPGIEVGEHALVGGMSLVTRDIPPQRVAIGSPAHDAGAVEDVRCKEGRLAHVYPWPARFHRGYPEGTFEVNDE